MSLAIKYENVEDAKMRLRNTIVLYKGDPVFIKDIRRGEGGDDILRVLFSELPLTREKVDEKLNLDDLQRKYISSKHFDIAPFKLGYCNTGVGKGAFYCTRLPNRIQKQGLCAENFSAKDNYGNGIAIATFTTSKGAPDMVKGIYPSFDEATKLLKKVPAVAFDRDFCLVRDEVFEELIFLYHKGAKVGFFSNERVTLPAKFKCLTESLQEKRVKVA